MIIVVCNLAAATFSRVSSSSLVELAAAAATRLGGPRVAALFPAVPASLAAASSPNIKVRDAAARFGYLGCTAAGEAAAELASCTRLLRATIIETVLFC